MRFTSEDILNAQKDIKNDDYQLPNTDELMDMIIPFLEYIQTEPMEKLEKTDPKSFEKHLDSKFSKFSERYYAVFKLLIDKKDRAKNVQKLIELFGKFEEVKEGKRTIDSAYKEFTEELNSEYIYPKFGGKDKFEKTIMDKHKNKK